VAELLRGSPLSAGKVDFAWTTAVGLTVQRATHVRLEGSVLLVDTTSGQWAREVMRSSPVILRRLQTLLGTDAVTAIQVRPPASDMKPQRRKTKAGLKPRPASGR
jgi:predicted nucleic acid-binding Zn ribbon protein